MVDVEVGRALFTRNIGALAGVGMIAIGFLGAVFYREAQWKSAARGDRITGGSDCSKTTGRIPVLKAT